MALKRNETYPGRFSNPTDDHPQGAFKNRSAPGAQDGSYLEQQWANDWDGFFGRLLTLAEISPNGNVDTASSSQYYDALKALFLQRTDPFGDIAADGAVAIATALSNLGLKEAAKRDVGTGINQIPDMSAWTSGSNWRSTPDGFIEVWGESTVASTSTGVAVATFPLPFPNECVSVIINEVTNIASGVSGVKSWGLARDTISKTGVSAILNVTGSPAVGEYFVYRAIGR